MMIPIKTLITLLAAFTSLTSTAAVIRTNEPTTPAHNPIIDTSPSSLNSPSSTLHTRAPKKPKCYSFGGTFHSNDIAIVAMRLENINYKDTRFLPAASTTERSEWRHNTMKLCVNNDHVVENTRVSNEAVGGALQEIYDHCCSKKETCFGGEIQTYGDNGVEIDVMTEWVSQECDGQWD
ncbi:MAG: hypothetical protein Q9166_005400 [cf. Caloplaca sp. 2 TL-2023]